MGIFVFFAFLHKSGSDSQLELSTRGPYKLTGDNVICTIGQVLLMSPSIIGSNQGKQRALLQLTTKRIFVERQNKIYPNCKEKSISLISKMKVSL